MEAGRLIGARRPEVTRTAEIARRYHPHSSQGDARLACQAVDYLAEHTVDGTLTGDAKRDFL